jgi:hypothetical protein
VTTYAAKKQHKTHNLSAIMADGYAYHLTHLDSKYIDNLRDTQRLLLFRLVHAINRQQELAAPMVISYMMGWGDTYKSHTYTPIYWSSFVGALLQAFPALYSKKGYISVILSIHLLLMGLILNRSEGRDEECSEFVFFIHLFLLWLISSSFKGNVTVLTMTVTCRNSPIVNLMRKPRLQR